MTQPSPAPENAIADAVGKAAFAAVAGRPSAGKSTLVNALCGQKVAIVSAAPQTTRNAVRGIVTTERGQIVFVDTPGRHLSEKKFNKLLSSISTRALHESDIVLYVLDASRAPGAEEEAIAATLRKLPTETLQNKTVIAINKIDVPAADIKRTLSFLDASLPSVPAARRFEISALQKKGTDALLAALFEIAPEGLPFYPAEYYTDQSAVFRAAEILREAALTHLRDELPHALFVDIEDAHLSNDSHTPVFNVSAALCVERESQKGMVVGKGGRMLARIREDAQKEFKRIFDWKVKLSLRVKTVKDWRSNERILKKLSGG